MGMRITSRETIEFMNKGRFGFLRADNLTDGPFPCDQCKELSCFCHITTDTNKVFCKNPHCGYQRTIDKRNRIIIENDGSHWQYYDDGSKVRIRGR